MDNKEIISETRDILSGVAVKPAKPPFHMLLLKTFMVFFHDLGKSICEIIIDLINGVLLFTGRLIGLIWLKTEKFRIYFMGKLKYFGIFVFSPFFKFIGAFSSMRRETKAANREYGLRGAAPVFFRHIFVFIFGKRSGGVVTTVFNYAAPFISIIFLVNIISYATDINYAVRLEVNGTFVGYVETELIFSEAEKIYKERLAFLGSATMIEITPRFTIEKVGYSRILTAPEVANILISKSGVSVDHAYGIIINNEFMGAVIDNSSIIATLEGLLNVHKTGAVYEDVAFIWPIDIKQGGLFPTENIVEPQTIINIITRRSAEAQFYTVVEGDNLYLISDKLDLSLDALERMNPGLSEQVLLPGERIQFSVEVPHIPVSVTRTVVYDQAIPFATERRSDNTVFVGNEVITVGGQPGYERVTARVTLVNGVETGRRTTGRETISAPVTQVISQGTRPIPGRGISNDVASYGKFIWPVPRDVSRVSEWGHWNGGYRGHTGVDISAPHGTAIYAGASGTVTFAGWSGGYGNLVIIDHDNGLRTYYSHCSFLYVRVGDFVSRGETIALVGMTGRADGNHLHFEVRRQSDNFILNPRDYLDF
ncbi:MAG: M23 family metallopeptidase [Oscillospiraceae bacterium]|jgi:murein DD-endopeptidase MepM/ murein hydrolase activator NlpD|nr:M23 family metallopeptidase [Oscillospiraceae bacterium]